MPRGDHLARVLKDIDVDVKSIASAARITKQQVYRILRGDSRTRESVVEILSAAYPEHAYAIRLAWERDQAPTLSMKLDELKKRARHSDEVATLRAARALAAGDDGAFSALALTSAEQLALLDMVAELRRTHPDNSIEPTIRRLLDLVRAMRPA